MLAMRLQKLTIVMAPLLPQRRHPAGVLHGALLLLCLVLLMRASAMSVSARLVPSDNDNGCNLEIAPCTQFEEGGTHSQEVSHMEKSALPRDEADEDDEADMSDCMSLPDSTTESCAEYINRRFLTPDYGSPGGNSDAHPGGPLP